MSRPTSLKGELPKYQQPQQSRPSQLARTPGRPSVREQHSAAKTSSAVLDKPSQQTSLPFRSLDTEELSFNDSLDSLTFDDFSDHTHHCPGFATYNEAEAARSRLPVHSLDLVPTICARSRCPVQLTTAVWLDRQSRPSSGWYDTSALTRFGQELAASACLIRADGSGQKYFAFVRDMWAIHEDEEQKVWHASYISVDDKAGLDDPIGRGFFTGGGPSWPLHSKVTLLAKAIDASGEFWIKSYPTAVTSEQ
ncbi:hypothetical protein WJX73_009546 [Symbiochloris irregularis]|uniref:Uncharacterized protein n=1 Tax=Symbiochloris irregularis TaxID=706552 RepID=A0AAW1Q060_9CHLO